MIFLTADEHFFHENIINYCNRPYATIDKMTSSLISRHNKVVTPNDVVYHVGDFMWIESKDKDARTAAKLLKRLNGRHILILGNHDELKPTTYVSAGFESVHTSLHLPHKEADGTEWNFYLVHDPSAFCVIPDSGFLLHGHIHTLYKHLMDKGQRAINVGVDVWDRAPVSIDQIIALIKSEGAINGRRVEQRPGEIQDPQREDAEKGHGTKQEEENTLAGG